MREILFRGKRVDNGEWAYGYYVESHRSMNSKIKPHKAWIVESFASNGGWLTPIIKRAIYDETVGQYTGLVDKYGTMLFEGDIIRDEDGDIMVVKWQSKGAEFVLELKPYVSVRFYSTLPSKIEIIGNIHDNPELLEADKNE